MTHFRRIESRLSIGHGYDEDEAALSQFFNQVNAQTPPDQKDAYFEFLHERFNGAQLSLFVHPGNAHTTSFVAKDEDRLVGVLFAERAKGAFLEEEGWLDPQDHMRVLWYGVKDDVRDVKYNAPEYEISKLLLSFLRRDLDLFDCKRMEALVHSHDFYTAKDLLECEFEYRGALSQNVQDGMLADGASAHKYERYVLNA